MSYKNVVINHDDELDNQITACLHNLLDLAKSLFHTAVLNQGHIYSFMFMPTYCIATTMMLPLWIWLWADIFHAVHRNWRFFLRGALGKLSVPVDEWDIVFQQVWHIILLMFMIVYHATRRLLFHVHLFSDEHHYLQLHYIIVTVNFDGHKSVSAIRYAPASKVWNENSQISTI